MKKYQHSIPIKSTSSLIFALLICFIGFVSEINANPNEAETILNSDAHDTIKIEQNYKLAGSYIYKNIDSATYYVEQGFELSKKNQYIDGIAQGYGFLGFLSRQQGNLSEAIQYYIKCLAIIQAQGYESEYPRMLNNLATLYLELDNYEKAKYYFEECIQLNTKNNAKKSLASNFTNLGLVYHHLNEFENSFRYFQKAINIRIEIKDTIGLASSYSYIGSLFEAQNDLDSALNYYNRSLIFRRLLNDRKGTSISLYQSGNIYFIEGQFKKALKYTLESFGIAKKWGYKAQERDASKVLYKIYKVNNNTTDALKYFERYNLLADSLNNIEAQKKVIESEFQFEYNKKHLVDSLKNKQVLVENELLEKENVLKENSLSIQRLWLFLAIIIVLALIILVILLRKNLKAKDTQLRTEVKLRLSEVLALQNQLSVQKEHNQTPIESINIILQDKLTEREQEVLDALVLGLPNKEIGEKLFLSINTIKTHIKNLYLKLDVNNRTQAAIKGSLLQMSEQK